MGLHDELKKTKSRYDGEIRQIKNFVNTTERSLTRKQRKKPKGKLEEDDKKELERLSDFFNRMADDDVKNEKLTIKSEMVSKLFVQVAIPIKHKSFLTEMTLSYLVAHQEAMLKDYLHCILVNRKSLLKSKSSITYQDVLSYTSMKSLIAHLAQKEVDQLGFGSIDDVERYFSSKMNINLSNFEKWDDIVEASFRRNIFIHNKGVANEKYCKAVGVEKLGKRLSVDLDYVMSISDNLISFNEFCFNLFVEKFKLS
ncbi:hypothetical protein [Marinobacter nauticus]|uniref:hypothetical protein n=1 Tax=Marinobacter nauticus TaxID=2743 RepID=UPI000EABB54D|nr:hypothetical protein [Marinobacter nauticus]RKR72096.1 hypothetical protein C7436_2455 [Marinobacter nauticus]